jgi:hypothetical protein
VAGTGAPNKPVFYRSAAAIQARSTQLGKLVEQFTNGCNRGVASGAIGVNTGEFNPKTTDFNRVLRYGVSASYIGQREAAVTANEDRLWALPDAGNQATTAVQVGFNTAASSTAPLANYGTTIVCANHTGLTMPAGSWAWGLVTGAAPVPPVVEAGPTYFNTTPFTPILLSQTTLTVGTDPSPLIKWTVFAGGTGTFSNDTILQPIFTGTFTTSEYTLMITVTPNDGPAVIDTVIVTSDG